MIKQLRIKFLAIAMISTTLVLLLIISSINIISFVNVNNNLDVKLKLLADNQGMIPKDEFYNMNIGFGVGGIPSDGNPGAGSTGEKSTVDASIAAGSTVDASAASEKNKSEKIKNENESGQEANFNNRIKNGRGPGNLSLETPYDTRFFTVTLNSDGSVSNIAIDNIAAIDSDTAKQYALSLLSSGSASGFIGNYKYVKTDFTADNQSKTMYIFVDGERELTAFKQFVFASVGISILGLLLVFVLLLLLSKRVVKPIAESYEKQKGFITDASHEIKTPLTIIDANTEVLEMDIGENEWTKSIHNQIGRLTELTNKLVFLSRMDEEATKLTMLDFALSDLVEEVAEDYVTLAKAKNKEFELDTVSGLSYYGDESNIRQMLSLLLDNAIKYSSENGKIKLSLQEKGKSKIITIWNTTDSIDKGKHDELFERFYRRDSSRNSSTGGHGIGLSVVKAIVNAHKGKISAESEDGQSLKITVILN